MAIKYIFLAGLLLLGGCRTIAFEAQGRKITYTNYFFDTKLGSCDITFPDGAKVHLENLDTSSQALTVASKALDLVNKIP